MEANDLNIHAIIPDSRVNGPGCRFVIWLQGCSLGCNSCFNPETHPTSGGIRQTIPSLLKMVETSTSIEGITFSGGEPLQQLPALLSFAQMIHERTTLSMLLFTGYTWDEIQENAQMVEVVALMDVVIAGRYLHHKRLSKGLLGSSNQTIHFITPRYNIADLELVSDCEIQISSIGSITISGIDPVKF